MKMSITLENFVNMKTVVRCLIECIFQKEESFKTSLIKGNWGWTRESYELNKVHLSGSLMRVEVRFDDYSTTDVILDLDTVYDWYENEFNEENNL